MSAKVVAFGLGALLAFFGCIMLTDGARSGNALEVSQGWILVGIAVVMWIVSALLRRI